MASKSNLSSAFGFSDSAPSSASRFYKGPSVRDYMEGQGLSEGDAALRVLYHLFGIVETADQTGPNAAPTQLRNALQWYASQRTKDVQTKDGRTVNIVAWSAFRIPAWAIGAARAASLTGTFTPQTMGTLARIYYADAKARDDVREHRAQWTGRPFVAMETSTQVAAHAAQSAHASN